MSENSFEFTKKQDYEKPTIKRMGTTSEVTLTSSTVSSFTDNGSGLTSYS